MQVIGLGVSNCIITCWRRKCALGSITIRGSRVEASLAAISVSTSSRSRFSRSTPKGCLIKYLLKSSNPLKYQLKSTVLYSSVCWKPSTALTAIVLIFFLAVKSCSSFSTVNYCSALRSTLRVLTCSLAWLASPIVVINSFFNFEFSASKTATRDAIDLTLSS